MPMTFKAAVELIAARMDYYANNHTAQCASWKHHGALLESCDCGIATAVHALELAAGQASAPTPLPDDDVRGLSIDMLDVDRLREWARLIGVHGADITHWTSIPHVVSKLQTIATSIEKAIRDIGSLRKQVAETSGVPASPQWLPMKTAPKAVGIIDIWAFGRRYADCTWHSIHGQWECHDAPNGFLHPNDAKFWMPLPDPPGATDTL